MPANVVNAKTVNVNGFKNEYDRNYRNDMDVRSRWACRSIILQVPVLQTKYRKVERRLGIAIPDLNF